MAALGDKMRRDTGPAIAAGDAFAKILDRPWSWPSPPTTWFATTARRDPARRIRQVRCDERAGCHLVGDACGRDLGFVTLHPDAFGAANAISIDYAVREKTARMPLPALVKLVDAA